MASRVLLVDADYDGCDAAIKAVFKEFPFALSGKKVFVKPNILGAFPVERGVTTHPAMVKAVVSFLKARGAIVTVGDNSGMPRAYGRNEGAATVTGILEASLGTYENIGAHGRRVKLGLEEYPEITVASAVLDCDFFISLPKFKTHCNTIITGGVKNSYGLVVGAEKTALHGLLQDQFARAVVAVYKIRKPDLVIMDAIVGMEGDGPSSPTLRRVGKVIASNDAVAVDAVMCQMMGADPELVHTMKVCRAQKVGEWDISRIKVIGKALRISDFKLPSTYNKNAVKDSLMTRMIGRIVKRGRLKIVRKKCILCKQCYEVCPRKAISWDGKPDIDQGKCILCFCCKEVCPNNAIQVGGLYGMMQKVMK